MQRNHQGALKELSEELGEDAMFPEGISKADYELLARAHAMRAQVNIKEFAHLNKILDARKKLLKSQSDKEREEIEADLRTLERGLPDVNGKLIKQ